MTWWQVYAIFLAVVFPVAALIGYIRSRKASHLFLLGQVFLFPELAFIAVAINPGPQAPLTVFLGLAFLVIAVDLVVMGWSIYKRRALLVAPISIAELDRFNDRARLSRALTILALVLLVFNFVPWLGVLYVVVVAAMTAIWIPVRMRTYRIDFSTELGASPREVFPFLVDPEKWALFRSGEVKILKLTPHGRLVVGTEMVARMPVRVGRHVEPFMLDTTTRITELVEDSSYSQLWVDRPYEHSRTDLAAVVSGTRLSFRLTGVMPFWMAATGAMLDMRSIIAVRRAELGRNYSKLNEILKAVPAQ